ncbi:hypothetical protein [Paraburkholderia sp. GAS32]|uniref:hypothetical protein n=1 Tax=Paraburkholderia sp. GAS32 TaxID=3035129 RepID=UPI003D22B8D7
MKLFHHGSNNKEKKLLMITHQLTGNDFRDLRIQLLLDSGQVPGISVQRETIGPLSEQPETPSSASGNALVQTIVQTFAQLGLALPFDQGSSTGSTLSVTKSAASGGTQGSNANSQTGSLSAAGIDSIFEQFIGQVLQVASSLQYGTSSSPASQSNSGNQENETSETGYSNPLSQALGSLARAVGARSTQPGDASENGGTGSTTSLNEAISSMEKDFNTLFGSSGTNKGASLQIFLQTFATNVVGESVSGSSGAFVRTSA